MTGANAATALRVRAGSETVDGHDEAAVTAAIGRANARAQLDGLDATLNPSLIDPARALALIAALPEAAVVQLGGLSLYLNAPDLPIKSTSPTTPASFAGLEGIEVVDRQGDTALVRLKVPIDCALAERQAAAARLAIAAVGEEVTRLEAAKATADSAGLRALSAARARRFAIACAWYENAAAVQYCSPGDAAAKELAAATLARSEFAVSTGGMP